MRAIWIQVVVLVSVFVVLIPSAAVSANEDAIVTQKEIEEYAETYLKTYRDSVEYNMHPKYWEYFDFYENYPYHVVATISTTHGAALQFIPSEAEYFEIRMVSEKIEQAIFKDKDLNIYDIGGSIDYTLIIYEGPAGKPVFKIGGARWQLANFSVITNKGYFIEVPELCDVLIDEVMVDNIDYDYPILIKGSNLEEHWTTENATNDALYYFETDIPDAFVKSEDFRKILAYPELNEIALKIKDKRDKGEYNKELGEWEFKKDIAELLNVALEYGVSSEINLDDFLKEVEEKPSFFERHPFINGILSGIVVTIIFTKVFPFLFRYVKKRYRESKEKNRSIKRSGMNKKRPKSKSKKRASPP